MAGRQAGWWDISRNCVGGCLAAGPGCDNCYAARWAATLHTVVETELYEGTAKWFWRPGMAEPRPIFNGDLTELPPGHREWTMPRWWKGAAEPVMGPGQPSLIFEADMCDLFVTHRPFDVIDRVLEPYLQSPHIGLLLTKYARQMAEYFHAGRPARERFGFLPNLPRRQRLWLGFSAEDQTWFDRRWESMRTLAEDGWLVYVAVAPMIGPVVLPDDFLQHGAWVIASGEQESAAKGGRWSDPDWYRALRDQCRDAGVPFFMNRLAHCAPIPRDLRIKQFPRAVDGVERPTPESGRGRAVCCLE